MSTDLSRFAKAADTPVDVVAEIRCCLPATAQDIAARLRQPTAFVLEALDAMRLAGIIAASDDDPTVWRLRRRLFPHCASSGQA